MEVNEIYAKLDKVEKQCIDVDNKQIAAALDKHKAQRTHPTAEQWKAQITLHQSLLNEHHDFFLATQHPSASQELRDKAMQYNMPTRLWRHAIYDFLEVLRHRLPGSLEHMLAFINIAFTMITPLLKVFDKVNYMWTEWLGDLGLNSTLPCV